MANLIRSTKSKNDWSANELLAYNITVQRQGAIDFFGRELDPIDHLDPSLLLSADPSVAADLSKEIYRFLAHLNLASRPNAGQESAVGDLAKSILEVTGFDEFGTILRTRYDIPFTDCGDPHRAARADMCLVHISPIIPFGRSGRWAGCQLDQSRASGHCGSGCHFSVQQSKTRGPGPSPSRHDDHPMHYHGGNEAVLLLGPSHLAAQKLCYYGSVSLATYSCTTLCSTQPA